MMTPDTFRRFSNMLDQAKMNYDETIKLFGVSCYNSSSECMEKWLDYWNIDVAKTNTHRNFELSDDLVNGFLKVEDRTIMYNYTLTEKGKDYLRLMKML